MKRRYLICKSALITVLFILPVALFVKNVDMIDVIQGDADSNSGAICRENTIGQTFLVTNPDLTRIDVVITPFHKTLPEKVVFTLTPLTPSKDAVEDKALVTIERRLQNSQKPRFYDFKFPPLHESLDTPYHFRLQCRECTLPDNAFTVLVHTGNPYRFGATTFNNYIINNSDLVFRTYYHKTIHIWDILKTLAGDKPGLLGYPLCYAVLFLLVAFILSLFLIYLKSNV